VETDPDTGKEERGHWCTICKYDNQFLEHISMLMMYIISMGRKGSLTNCPSSKVVCQCCKLTLQGNLTITLCIRTSYTFIRHNDHFQAYKERCSKLGISTHECATPKSHGVG
jgi:hypothetical protein